MEHEKKAGNAICGMEGNEPLFLFLPIYASISDNCDIKFRKKLPGMWAV
jgi:hypothetical protein